MYRFICDKCGKDITTNVVKYSLIIQPLESGYSLTNIYKHICEECKDELISMLDKG